MPLACRQSAICPRNSVLRKKSLCEGWECDSVHVLDSFGLGKAMRGRDRRSEAFFSHIPVERRIFPDHPMHDPHADRRSAGTSVAGLRYALSRDGRPSIPPEQLLRVLLQAFYSVRSEGQLMEQLDYNLLLRWFRWFVGLSADDPMRDVTKFCKNRDRLLDGSVR
jgi:hypothetical protein